MEKDKQRLLNEMRILRMLKHPKIIKFDHYFEDNDYKYEVIELCSNGNLHELLEKRNFKLHELEI